MFTHHHHHHQRANTPAAHFAHYLCTSLVCWWWRHGTYVCASAPIHVSPNCNRLRGGGGEEIVAHIGFISNATLLLSQKSSMSHLRKSTSIVLMGDENYSLYIFSYTSKFAYPLHSYMRIYDLLPWEQNCADLQGCAKVITMFICLIELSRHRIKVHTCSHNRKPYIYKERERWWIVGDRWEGEQNLQIPYWHHKSRLDRRRWLARIVQSGRRGLQWEFNLDNNSI